MAMSTAAPSQISAVDEMIRVRFATNRNRTGDDELFGPAFRKTPDGSLFVTGTIDVYHLGGSPHPNWVDDLIGHVARQGDTQSRKNARHRRRQNDSPQNYGSACAAILRAPNTLDPAKAEIARHHDRIEAFEKGECDLRGCSDAEYIGENGKQGDLRNRIADEENRLEQIAHEGDRPIAPANGIPTSAASKKPARARETVTPA